MISATPAYLAANSKPNKLPVYVIQIAGYNRAFYTFPRTVNRRSISIPHLSPIPVRDVIPTTTGEFVPTSDHPGYGAGSATADSGELDRYESHSLSGWGAPGVLLFGMSAGSRYAAPGADGAGAQPRSVISKVEVVFTYESTLSSNGNSPGYSIDISYDGGSSFSGIAFGIVGAHSPTRITRDITSALGSIATFDFTQLQLRFSEGSSLLWGRDDVPAKFLVTGVALRVSYSIPFALYPWIVEGGIQDLTLTVNDLDGSSDLSDLVFSVQDPDGEITADFPNFLFEGKRMRLLSGFVGLDGADFLTLFTGRVDSVESANDNNEYMFTCPDIRNELGKVIFTTGDDGFPTDSDHPRTLNGHPLDILLAILEDEIGLDPDDIDLAKIAEYRDTIYASQQFEFRLSSPPAANEFIAAELLKPLGAYHRSDNLGRFTIEFYYPLDPTPVFEFTPENVFAIPGAGQAPLINQVSFRYDADKDDKLRAETVTNDAGSIAKYEGLYGQQIIEAKGVRSGLQGATLAALTSFLIFMRYSDKQLLHGSSGKNASSDPIDATWETLCVEPGDLVTMTNPNVPDRSTGTMGITGKTYVVMDKVMQLHLGHCRYKLLEVKNLDAFKHSLITPDAEADYVTASADDKAKYMFLSGDDGKYSNSDAGKTLT